MTRPIPIPDGIYRVSNLPRPHISDPRFATKQEAEVFALEESFDRVLGIWDGAELIEIIYNGVVFRP
jgi:hypothetical protein